MMIPTILEDKTGNYVERQINIVKNVFQTKIVEFSDAENKISFQYTLTERESGAISFYLGNLIMDVLPENKFVTGTIYHCTPESFIKLKKLYDSINEGKCPKCSKLGKFIPPSKLTASKKIIILNFICPYGHTFTENHELLSVNL